VSLRVIDIDMILTVNLPFFFFFRICTVTPDRSCRLLALRDLLTNKADTSQFQRSQIHLPSFRQVFQF
jgi:hypothetical protein